MKAKGPRIILFHCTFKKTSVPPGLSALVLEYNVWRGGIITTKRQCDLLLQTT